MKELALFSLIVTEIAGFTGAGLGLGYLAFKKWGFPTWTLVVTGLLGLAAGMVQVVRQARALKEPPGPGERK